MGLFSFCLMAQMEQIKILLAIEEINLINRPFDWVAFVSLANPQKSLGIDIYSLFKSLSIKIDELFKQRHAKNFRDGAQMTRINFHDELHIFLFELKQ